MTDTSESRELSRFMTRYGLALCDYIRLNVMRRQRVASDHSCQRLLERTVLIYIVAVSLNRHYSSGMCGLKIILV